jgi:hypothetical protein
MSDHPIYEGVPNPQGSDLLLWEKSLSEQGRHFGEHLVLDGYGGCPDRLNDAEVLTTLLDALVAGLHMKMLSGPVVCVAPGSG